MLSNLGKRTTSNRRTLALAQIGRSLKRPMWPQVKIADARRRRCKVWNTMMELLIEPLGLAGLAVAWAVLLDATSACGGSCFAFAVVGFVVAVVADKSCMVGDGIELLPERGKADLVLLLGLRDNCKTAVGASETLLVVSRRFDALDDTSCFWAELNAADAISMVVSPSRCSLMRGVTLSLVAARPMA